MAGKTGKEDMHSHKILSGLTFRIAGKAYWIFPMTSAG